MLFAGCTTISQPQATAVVDIPTATVIPTTLPTSSATPTPTVTPSATLPPTLPATAIFTPTTVVTAINKPNVTITPTIIYSATLPLTSTIISPLTSTTTITTYNSSIEQVVIISLDGLRPDALAQADTPILDQLLQEGAYQPTAQAVLPSVTLVNHASMLSGMSPQKHGIDWNVTDPEAGFINGPTLFTVAKLAGLRTAMVVGKPKLNHIAIPNSVDAYIYAGFLDTQVINRAIALVHTDMPDILFVHLPDVDSAGHQMGWMSNTQLWVINSTDSLIGDFITALDETNYLDSTLLIITSDHGGIGYRHGSDQPENMTIPWLAVGPNVPQNQTIMADITTYDTAATVLYAFNLTIPVEWDGQPVTEIFQP